MSEESYKASTLTMQLHDNLALWTSDMKGDGKEQNKEEKKNQ